MLETHDDKKHNVRIIIACDTMKEWIHHTMGPFYANYAFLAAKISSNSSDTMVWKSLDCIQASYTSQRGRNWSASFLQLEWKMRSKESLLLESLCRPPNILETLHSGAQSERWHALKLYWKILQNFQFIYLSRLATLRTCMCMWFYSFTNIAGELVDMLAVRARACMCVFHVISFLLHASIISIMWKRHNYPRPIHLSVVSWVVNGPWRLWRWWWP